MIFNGISQKTVILVGRRIFLFTNHEGKTFWSLDAILDHETSLPSNLLLVGPFNTEVEAKANAHRLIHDERNLPCPK